MPAVNLRPPVRAFLLPLVLPALLLLLACRPGPTPPPSPTPAPPSSNGRLFVEVHDGGWTRVPADSLRPLGLDLARVDPASLRLFEGDLEIPALRSRAGVEFFARPSGSALVSDNAYRLEWSAGSRGLDLPTRRAAPPPGDEPAVSFTDSLTLEQNHFYIPMALETDRWLWQPLTAPGQFETPVRLPDFQPGGPAPGAELQFWAASQDDKDNPDHHLRIQWNGQTVSEVKWDGRGPYTATLTFPALAAADNTLKLVSPGDTGAAIDFVYLDRLRFRYPRALRAVSDRLEFETPAPTVRVVGFRSGEVQLFDVTDPRAPVRLLEPKIEQASGAWSITFATSASGASPHHFVLAGREAALAKPSRLTVPAGDSLRDPALHADEIIITAPELAAEIKPLVEWRAARGLTAVVVTTSQVYADFAGGRADPAALRNFIAYALDHWQPAPRFVLLIGKASYDVNNYLAGPNPNLLPTFLLPTPDLGQAASDNWFTSRGESDPTPRLAIGRIPAKTPAQVKTVVDKIKSYEGQAGHPAWQSRAVFIADSQEAQFTSSVDKLASRLPTSLAAVKLLPASSAAAAAPDKADLETRRAAILKNWTDGALLMTYIGHGSIDTWSQGPLLSSKDITGLSNKSALPILLTPTCLDGFFYHPQQDSLAEQLLFNSNGGIIAGIVPTGLSTPSAQDEMVDALATAWFETRVPTLGEAMTQAKTRMPHISPAEREVIETFVLLGDPALALPQPPLP